MPIWIEYWIEEYLLKENHDSIADYSVVIGRVSTEDGDRILETLEALHTQEGSAALEILIADRLGNEVTVAIRRKYPDVTIIECGPETDLPTMRTEALQRASGRYVLVTEDHCVPPSDWLKRFSDAIARYPDAAAIGGCVINGVTDTGLDWATFLCEYASMLPPIETGPAANIAGMNVAYRREILTGVDQTILKSGFWETTLHPMLRRQGYLLVADGDVRIYHCKKFSLRLFLRQRFVYSRYFAGIRLPRKARLRRLLFAGASLALPALLAVRFVRDARHKATIRTHLSVAAPYLLLFYCVWGLGEAWGYLFGARDALQEIE